MVLAAELAVPAARLIPVRCGLAAFRTALMTSTVVTAVTVLRPAATSRATRT